MIRECQRVHGKRSEKELEGERGCALDHLLVCSAVEPVRTLVRRLKEPAGIWMASVGPSV